MDMSLIAVDVDGSFANPIMKVAVFTWSAVLTTCLTIAFLRVRRRGSRAVTTLTIAVLGCVSSPFANRGVAILIYQATSKPGVIVGFFGGPPFWLSTLFAFAATGVIALLIGRIPSTPRSSEEILQA